jgi:hypothetical protein
MYPSQPNQVPGGLERHLREMVLGKLPTTLGNQFSARLQHRRVLPDARHLFITSMKAHRSDSANGIILTQPQIQKAVVTIWESLHPCEREAWATIATAIQALITRVAKDLRVTQRRISNKQLVRAVSEVTNELSAVALMCEGTVPHPWGELAECDNCKKVQC